MKATVDVRKNCAKCTDMAITHLEVDLHEDSLWESRIKNVASSAGATLAANAAQFLLVEAINQGLGLEKNNRIQHELSVVIVNKYHYMRIQYVISQDHDGDGDITEQEGWNHISNELASLIVGDEVHGIFSTSGNMGLGHHLTGMAGAAAGMHAAKKVIAD